MKIIGAKGLKFSLETRSDKGCCDSTVSKITIEASEVGSIEEIEVTKLDVLDEVLGEVRSSINAIDGKLENVGEILDDVLGAAEYIEGVIERFENVIDESDDAAGDQTEDEPADEPADPQ